MLKVNNLNVHYGVINAVKNVTFDVNEGEIVALIGANGAGKTSIMHALSGLLKSTIGDIFFMDKNINKMPAHKIIAEGLAQVPEGRRIFAQLSVEDNLEMGAYLRTDKIGIERDLENIYNKFPRLKERKHQLAGTLSGGEQQRVAIARALAKNPKLLLCDEPTGALDYNTGKSILKLLQDTCRKMNMTVIIITHNLALTPMGDKVIKVKNGKIESVVVNDNPTPVERIEW